MPRGGGTFCEEFQFWYFIPRPEKIKLKTLKDGLKHSELVSINCLEFEVVIISYNVVIDAIELLCYCEDTPQSKSLILSDNTAAYSWTRKIAASSIIGKVLCRIFCPLLINQSAGLDSTNISGVNND